MRGVSQLLTAGEKGLDIAGLGGFKRFQVGDNLIRGARMCEK